MGRVGEAMRGFWEGVGGFFYLGARDAANRVAIMARGLRARRIDRSTAAQMVLLGRKAWEERLQISESIPVVDRIQALEQAAEQKRISADRLKDRVGELREQRREHVALYQRKTNEQLKLKRPIDLEHTGLLVEGKRLRKEIASNRGEIKTLSNKIELQAKRLAELEKAGGEPGGEYLISEIRGEVEFNERSRALKIEKEGFLKSKSEELLRRAEKIGKVLHDYDAQIADLTRSHNEGASQIDASVRKLQDERSRIERDVRRITAEMRPLFGELGIELSKRQFDHESLHPVYAELARLEKKRDNHLRAISKRRSDSAGIGFGIKFGFYGLILILLLLSAWLMFVLLR